MSDDSTAVTYERLLQEYRFVFSLAEYVVEPLLPKPGVPQDIFSLGLRLSYSDHDSLKSLREKTQTIAVLANRDELIRMAKKILDDIEEK